MLDLRRFAVRVRLVRAWRGAAMGACAGALAAAGWSGLDWLGRADATPAALLSLVVFGGVLGSIAGAALRLPAKALRSSVDRRAGLENRLTASAVDVPFAEEVRADAEARLGVIRPASLYPLRVGRWHAGALAAMALAASIFLLGSTPILLNPEAKASRAEMAKKGADVERITKAQFETPEAQKEMTEAERRLVEEARRLQRDLEKGRLTKEGAMRKASALQQQAQDLAKAAAERSQRSLSNAETAMQKMERESLHQSGLGAADPSVAQMPQDQKTAMQAQSAQKQDALKAQASAIDKKLAELQKKLAAKGLSDAERKAMEGERKALEGQKSELEKEAEKARKEAQALKLSDAARATLDKMQNEALMKEIRKIAAELAKSNRATMQTGQPPLTKDQLAQMKAKLEALLAQLKDDAAMKKYLQEMLDSMREAMKQGNGASLRPGGFGVSLGSLLGLQSGMPAPGGDGTFMDTGHINKLDKPEEGKGKTFATQIHGERRETGQDTFVEIKAPTTVGNRTSVPYRSVLPSYRKKAEAALDHQEIPKDRERRVRAYFESLTKG